ncbi:TIGR02452 family protein [Streptomyces sp. H27-H5]|uniref:TIGR02452 family protein n=1 Tax=Streptomyces sp. H27-H5 TaxID=2996460 RepID=UPI00226F8007|nr:TIGR02452 family protein [Streptomyces sp. H27-H5]MCY0958111.1 TIGR02452 family protein [Streptomyces sp. H27-H5]
MSSRLREIARENATILAAGGYRTRTGRQISLAAALVEAKAGTRIYGPNRVIPYGEPLTKEGKTAFEVTGESSTVAAHRLAKDAPRGVRVAYTDRVIHSPAVPVFRDDRGGLLETPFPVAFLTSPAPNAGTIRRQEPERAHEIPGALARRAELVLEVAALHGHRRLVLGAWGCGVFRNEPAAVAEAFRELLTGRFDGVFERVVFGVLDRAPEPRQAFERAFAGLCAEPGSTDPGH